MAPRLRSGYRLLFTGDSVTDCGRREDPDGLGHGYVREIAAALATLDVEVLNTGVGGDRTVDLKKRWQEDVTDRSADVLTVLIGINDTWRRYDNNELTPAADFEEDYRYLLQNAGASVKQLVLIEPFVLPVTPEQQQWSEDLDEKQAIVAALAQEFDAVLIRAAELLAAQVTSLGAEALAADGVHPTPLGHRALAQLWLEAVVD